VEPEPAVVAALATGAGTQVVLAGWTKSGGLLTERDIRLTREVVHGDLVVVAPLNAENIEPVVRFRPEGVMLVASGWKGDKMAGPVQLEVDASEIADAVSAYRAAGVLPSALVEPDAAALKIAARCGLAGVVLDASGYTGARTDEEAEDQLSKLNDSAMAAQKFGLLPAAAHGLNYRNIGPVAGIRFIEELYVGGAVIARALVVGLDRAIAEMLAVINHNIR